MQPSALESRFRAMAAAQGVSRPFDILVRMPVASRHLIARALRCRLRETDTPEGEAWRIINQNLRGLQARTHSLPEQLSPFARNNNWWEIVTRTARHLGVQFYPGLKDEEVERLVFERFAELCVARHLQSGGDAIDFLAGTNPDFHRAIQSLRLSANGNRTVLGAILFATVRADENVRYGAKLVGDWIRERSRWSWAVSISSGLRLLQQKLTEIYDTWVTRWQEHGSNLARVSAALAVIYFQDLVDRTLEEFELVGA
jgi:hypothetical protein